MAKRPFTLTKMRPTRDTPRALICSLGGGDNYRRTTHPQIRRTCGSSKEKALDPENSVFICKPSRAVCLLHGGFGMGLERLTAKLLGLENVKEATLFPRDLNRIDTLLSTDKPLKRGVKTCRSLFKN